MIPIIFCVRDRHFHFTLQKSHEDNIPDSYGENRAENLKSCSTDSLNELSRLPLSNEPDFHFFSDTELTPGCRFVIYIC